MNINFIVSKVCLLHLGKNFVESIFPEMTKMHRIESFTTNGRNGYIITYELSFFEMIQKKKEKESNFSFLLLVINSISYPGWRREAQRQMLKNRKKHCIITIVGYDVY